MQNLKERVAYVQGLANGLKVSGNTPEGRILQEVMDLLEDVVRALDRVHVSQADLEEYVAAIDEDLTDLENDYYEEYDEYVDNDLSDMDEDDELEYFEMECPNCHETVFVDSDVYEDDEVVEVLCPECHEAILVNDDTPVTT
ncbi:CD1247 N-terminal domain-containing protein [Effusibacillus lacus]|uniref:AraC family transcriptional regulator n=1 Tax=Effusibacillus lacus TaxID=1348429 RepID=A0A292YQZ1_9BACL|nr:CD1247 N-terminal domain-containing protein [Effusibacillus lacus]TCS72537.1 hypothetical protein EDD64_12141 [Effusibacillus lacus]GAX90900.1 hypothetical protein EFBL_2542 [Effusibacillus lacus]